MRKHVILFFLLACLTARPAIAGETGTPRFERLSIEEGLSQSTAKRIIQDHNGFIWITTYGGLNKYDGQRFTCYVPESGNPHSISSSQCSDICETRDGFLWIGTQNAGLNRYDPRTGRFTRFQKDPANPGSLAGNVIMALLEDSRGVLWIATFRNGLHKYNPGTQTFTRYPHDPATPPYKTGLPIFDISEGPNGKLWLATQNGISIFNPETGTFRHLLPNHGKKKAFSNYVTKIYHGLEGNTWAALRGGVLYRLNLYGETAGSYKIILQPGEDDVITAIHQDPGGTLWLGTNREGLKKFNPGTGEIFTYSHDYNNPTSLGSNYIRDIYSDRSGLLWVGTSSGGAYKLDRRKEQFRTYRHNPHNPAGLGQNIVWSLFEGRGDILWVVTNNRGLDKLDRKTGTFTHYRHDPRAPGSIISDNLFCALRDGSGIIWVGTQASGLEKFDPATGIFTHDVFSPTGPRRLLDNSIIHLLEDQEGAIWIATFNGLNRWDPKTGQLKSFRHDPHNPRSLPGNSFNSLYLDRSGTLWLCIKNQGAAKFNAAGNTFARYMHVPGTANGPLTNQINCVFESRTGVFWFGTDGEGLGRMDPVARTFTHFSRKQGLPNNVIFGILEDNRGNLWVSTNRGLSCFDPTKEFFKNYGIRAGIQGYEFNGRSAFKGKGGKMYFGGSNGFSSFIPEEIRDNPHIPPIVLTGFKILGRPIGTGGDSPLRKNIQYTRRLELSHRQNIFSFEFAALDYTNPSGNQYKYRMDGLHNDWIHLGHETDASFTALLPGDYTFRITGSNSDGLWNETGLTVEITITPPFWQTTWFRLLAVLLFIAGVLVWHRLRMNMLEGKIKTETSLEVMFEKYQLSKREREIVQLVLKGKTNRDIEEELFISLKTVKCHVYNIYQKIGVRNRLELITRLQGR